MHWRMKVNASDEIRAAHLDLSDHDWKFRECASDDPAYLSRSSFPEFENPHPIMRYRLQSWPTFVRRQKIDELRSMSVGISNLIRSIPERIFQNNAAAIDEFYGLNLPALTEILLEQPNGLEGALSRGDFVLTSSGFKCIEFNVVANLGGWETGLLADMHMNNPVTSKFIAEYGIRVKKHDTLDILFSHILNDAGSGSTTSDNPINIAFAVDSNEDFGRLNLAGDHFTNEYRKFCGKRGLSTAGVVIFAKISDLILDQGRLKFRQDTVDAVVELYEDVPETIFRCFKSGALKLYNGPMSRILSDKRNIAILSEWKESGKLSPEERALIEKYVPWTRRTQTTTVRYRGEDVPLSQLLEGRREDFVLKNTLLAGGEEVYVGRFTPAAKWAEVIDTAIHTHNWIAQEYVQSLPYLYQNGDYGCSPHNVVWGPFVFGKEYAGCILRMQPQADQTVVNLTLTATEGLIFEVDE